MTWDQAAEIAHDIMAVTTSDDDFNELRSDFIAAASKYANIRLAWFLADRDGRRRMDNERTKSHDSFISQWHATIRYMGILDCTPAWAHVFTDDRKSIGDFACYLCAWLGIRAR